MKNMREFNRPDIKSYMEDTNKEMAEKYGEPTCSNIHRINVYFSFAAENNDEIFKTIECFEECNKSLLEKKSRGEEINEGHIDEVIAKYDEPIRRHTNAIYRALSTGLLEANSAEDIWNFIEAFGIVSKKSAVAMDMISVTSGDAQ